MYKDKPYRRGFVNLELPPELNRDLCISAAKANRTKASEIYHRVAHSLENYEVVICPDKSVVFADVSMAKKVGLKS